MTVLAHLRRGVQRAQQILRPQNFAQILKIISCLESSFVPKRVLVLTKVSKYQIEKLSKPHLNEDQLRDLLLSRGTNYDAMIAGHQRNKATELRVVDTLKNLNIKYRIRNRNNVDMDSSAWADLIMAVGGDGTFLLASNLISNNTKPILGINSDPEYSEGFLMLPPKYTNNIQEIFKRLKSGNFEYLMRSRIRITLHGEDIWQPPFHTHDKSSLNENEKFYVIHHKATYPKGKLPKTRLLPWLAVNEVFIGECFSARISIFHVNVSNNSFEKVKSSGMCVSTGTGSTSWYRAINSVNPKLVNDILSKAGYQNNHTDEELKRICYKFNSDLQYPAEQPKLSYTIRDMIVKHSWPLPNQIESRDFCDKLTVRSQCSDGELVIDGGIAIHFNVGTTAVLETFQEDALRNIVLPD